jgi:hypothetical protein
LHELVSAKDFCNCLRRALSLLFRGCEKMGTNNPIIKTGDPFQNSEFRRKFGFFRRVRRFIFDYKTLKIIYKKNVPESYDSALLRQLHLSDIDTIAAFYGIDKKSRKYNDIKERFGNGGECYGLFGDTPISIAWVYRIQYQLGNIKINLRLGEALIADSCVSIAASHDSAKQLEDSIAAFLNHQGIKPLIFSPAVKAEQREESSIYSIRQVRILGLSFARVKVNPAFLPLRFS